MIIGGGIVGCAIAAELSKRIKDVVLIEKMVFHHKHQEQILVWFGYKLGFRVMMCQWLEDRRNI